MWSSSLPAGLFSKLAASSSLSNLQLNRQSGSQLPTPNAACDSQPWLACRLTQELELKQHELELVNQRRAASSSAQLDAAVQASKAGLEEAATAVQAAKQRQADCLQEAKVLGSTGCL